MNELLKEEDIQGWLEQQVDLWGYFKFTVSDIVFLLIIYISTSLVVGILDVVSRQILRHNTENSHKNYVTLQIMKYLVYFIASYLVVDGLDLQVEHIFGALGFLFVGIGMGLQGLTNDIFSGLLLLFFKEGVKVGHIVEVGGLRGRVKEINLRTTTIETRESREMVIPNSKFFVENVINLSKKDNKASGFAVRIGVQYGTDTEMMKDLLLGIIKANGYVLQNNKDPFKEPRVYFKEFGDNALLFDMVFYTEEVWEMDWVKSELMFEVDRAFREKGIVMAFPQRDVHLKVEKEDLGAFREIFRQGV